MASSPSRVLYLVENPDTAGGIWAYANRFEEVFREAGIEVIRFDVWSGDPKPVLGIWEKSGCPPIHLEFSANSIHVFEVFSKLASIKAMQYSGTVHDSPFLVWGPSNAFFPRVASQRIFRKSMDLLFARSRERALFYGLKGLITLTEVGRDLIIRRLGPHSPPALAIRHVSFPTGYAKQLPLNVSSRPLRLLLFGELRKDKGLDDLVRGLVSLPEDILELHVVGDGPMRPWFIKTYEAYDKKPTMIYHGFVPDIELPGIFAQVNSAILPYRRRETAGASGILMRVMGAGLCPMVPSDERCLTEYVKDGITGLHFQRGDLRTFLEQRSWDIDRMKCLGSVARGWCELNASPTVLANEVGYFFQTIFY